MVKMDTSSEFVEGQRYCMSGARGKTVHYVQYNGFVYEGRNVQRDV